MTTPFEIKMTEKEAFDGLKSNYGTEFTAADVRAFCAMNDIGYSTVTGKIKQYKVGKGKWNLKVTPKAVKNIEKAFEAPAVCLLYTSPSPRDKRQSRMPSSA